MFKKTLSITIGIIIILNSSFVLWNQVSNASEDMGVIKICKLSELNDYLSKTARDDFMETLDDDKNENDLDVRIAFEKARTKYHNAVKCVFDATTIKILGSAAGKNKEVKGADDMPSLTKEVLAELNKPDKACALIEKGTLKDILMQDGPQNLVPKVLNSYEHYADFIRYLIIKQANRPSIDTSAIGFYELVAHAKALGLIMENEIQDSIVALDTAFLALKELRLSFVMHIHFQCMMKNLEVYRKMLGKLRKLVMTTPGLIEDASMHK